MKKKELVDALVEKTQLAKKDVTAVLEEMAEICLRQQIVICSEPRTLDVATGVDTLNTVFIRASLATLECTAPRRRPMRVVEVLAVSVLSLIFMMVSGSTVTV